jgi:hypothetical protein
LTIAAATSYLPIRVLRGVPQHLEGFLLIALVVAHQDALGLLDHGARLECRSELLTQRLGGGVRLRQSAAAQADEDGGHLLVVDEGVASASTS